MLKLRMDMKILKPEFQVRQAIGNRCRRALLREERARIPMSSRGRVNLGHNESLGYIG